MAVLALELLLALLFLSKKCLVLIYQPSNKKTKKLTFLRIALIVIFLVHSLAGMFNNGINDFGNLYLNNVGFAFGLGNKLSYIERKQLINYGLY